MDQCREARKKESQDKRISRTATDAESDPDSNDLYQANLLNNFCPNRPAALSHVCLYGFVKWYHRGDIMKKEIKKNLKRKKENRGS